MKCLHVILVAGNSGRRESKPVSTEPGEDMHVNHLESCGRGPHFMGGPTVMQGTASPEPAAEPQSVTHVASTRGLAVKDGRGSLPLCAAPIDNVMSSINRPITRESV